MLKKIRQNLWKKIFLYRYWLVLSGITKENQRIKEMDYKDPTCYRNQRTHGKIRPFNWYLLRLTRAPTGKLLPQACRSPDLRALGVSTTECRRTAHPKASTLCPSRLGGHLLTRAPLGARRTAHCQSATYSTYIASQMVSKPHFWKTQIQKCFLCDSFSRRSLQNPERQLNHHETK